MAQRVFEVEGAKTHEVRIGSRLLAIRGPGEPERLLDAIDAASFAKDELMPYWAELWPVGIAFARKILEGALVLHGKSVLELGSGLGLAGIAAALAGASEVTFSDIFEESLCFSAENARRNGVSGARTLLLDWRRPCLERRYDAVIGADLLYESRNLGPVLDAIEAALAPGGRAYTADPGRLVAEPFASLAEARGFCVERSSIGERGTLFSLHR